MNRFENIKRLENEEFDLCIIGGGASGAGCALDAALRGLKVALVEKTDFASETSSKSTKLVHGGVRYLEQAFKKLDLSQLRQMRHGLKERRVLLHNAPHLAQPLALITPVFSWWENLYFAVGLRLYDWFASFGRQRLADGGTFGRQRLADGGTFGRQRLADGEAGHDVLPKSRRLTRSETLHRMPGLTPRIYSAVLYYDGRFNDARYCLALIQSAVEAGAVVANYSEVVDFQKDEKGKLAAAKIHDRLSGEKYTLRADLFLNCTGPFADKIRLLANPGLTPRIRPAKGVHVVLPHTTLGSDDALLIPKTKDGRVVFAIPFEGQLLLGTTDDDFPDLENEPLLESKEVEFLLKTLQPFVAQKIDSQWVKAGFGGLRPLISPPHGGEDRVALSFPGKELTESAHPPSEEHQGASFPANEGLTQDVHPSVGGPGGASTSALLRDHEVEHDPASNLLSLLGGKWTTYRIMAKDALDSVCALLDIQAECRTEKHLLTGAEGYDGNYWKKIQADYGFDADISQHLAQQYGSRACKPAELAVEKPELAERLLPGFPFLKAEIVYAVREEMACTLRDFLARRIRLEMSDWTAARQATPEVAEIMGAEMGWTADRRQNEAAAYMELIEKFRKRADLNHPNK